MQTRNEEENKSPESGQKPQQGKPTPGKGNSNTKEGGLRDSKSDNKDPVLGQPQGIQMPETPSIELPKGGGSIQGMGEKFQSNPVTGTGSFSVPIAMSAGRGLTPALGLQYDSGNGNSVYGLGWSSGLPSISRKTQRNLPTYCDEDDSDTFLISGAEDLIPTLVETAGVWEQDTRTDTATGFFVKKYRPRIEGLFARIERWEDPATGISFWKSITPGNITTWYGRTAASRIADPANPKRIYQWLIDETRDDKGNVVVYQYKQENSDGLSTALLHDKNRLKNGNASAFQYLKKVKYGNSLMWNHADYDTPDANKWYFQLVFDYGEHLPTNPTPDDTGDWTVRQDPWSTYRAGFEIRTNRLCQRILMFHDIPALDANPVLVKSTNLTYNENPVATQLSSVTHWSYETGEIPDSMPPVEFTYSEATRDTTLRHFDVDDLENLPAGLDGQKYTWTDLDGEGISGILVEEQGGWHYKRNYGDESYYYDYSVANPPEPDIRFGALETVATRPTVGSVQQLTDLDGDGQLELVIRNQAMQGYFELKADGVWETFKAFEHAPNINWNDPNLRLIDLNGDGIADVLLTEDDCLRWYPSYDDKSGHGPALQTARHRDEEQGPALVFADSEQSVYLADMCGDGLTDIVRIQNGAICYWPNLGYGHFGAKVAMDNAPFFGYPEQFNQRQLRLVDVDGSGVPDIVYLGATKVSYWSNRSGNAWSLEQEIENFPPTDNATSVQVLDLFGKGTACIVWSSPLPGDEQHRVRYIDLMGQKPYLLTEVNNNMGAIQRLHYRPSTEFYLRDRQEGKPWITKLPFPVQVLVRTESYDEVTQARFVSRFAYHHGYFDRHEREFRGFGMVEQWDTEDFEAFGTAGLFQVGSNALDEASHTPPVYTKTWFHTGYYEQGKSITQQYAAEFYQGDTNAWPLADSTIPQGLKASEEREALRALKGSPLRVEVYGLDGSAAEAHPYTVTETNYEVKLIQPRPSSTSSLEQKATQFGRSPESLEGRASLLTTPSETLSYHYERDPYDPRISHQLVLITDEFGQVTQSAAVAYPRRGTGHDAQQMQGWATYAEIDLINEPDNDDWYRLGVPHANWHYELTGLDFSDKLTRADLLSAISSATAIGYEIAPTTGLEARLLGHQKVLYWNEDLTSNLTWGQVASHALPYWGLTLALTTDMVDAAFNNDGTTRLTAAMITGKGKYVNSGDDYWVPSDISIFDPANFYRVNQVNHITGGFTQLTYDAYNLTPLTVTDPYSNVVTADIDYRLMAPWQTTDPNGNRQQVAFDVLGMVNKVAVMGKTSESLGDTLTDPTQKLSYDLFNWMNNQQPNFVKTEARETHQDSGTNWLTSYEYSGGMGQTILVKVPAEPGLAPQRDGNGDLVLNGSGEPNMVETDPRWVGNGRTIFNNKGLTIKQYEPYFSSTHEFEDEDELRTWGVTPVAHYDPLGRNTRTDLPDGTFTKVEFDQWSAKNYDQNDTVIDSDWLKAIFGDPLVIPATEPPSNALDRAAWLAVKHYNTPQIQHLDSLGRPYRTQDDNGSYNPVTTATNNVYYDTTVALDIENNQRKVTNALGQETVFTYGMGGAPFYTDSPDGGWRRMLSHINGSPAFAWDERGQAFRNDYDQLQRPLIAYHTPSGGSEIVIGVSLYGDAPGTSGSSTYYNLRGQLVRQADQSGISKLEQVDFKGNPIRTTKVLATNYKTNIDWTSVVGINHQGTFDTTALNGNLIETENFTTVVAYDAFNRPTLITQPDGTLHKPGYNEAALLETMDVQLAHETAFTQYVTDIDYDVKGQRTDIYYGNNSKTRYDYDKKTYRLTRLLTTRANGTEKLQDLNYTYDPIGNITQVTDAAQPEHYFDNTVVSPTGKYTYDALYRLLSGTGRENVSLGAPGNTSFSPYNPIPLNNTGGNDLENYLQAYNYDALGNMLSVVHTLSTNPSNGWTRTYSYNTNFPNNYLQSAYTGSPGSTQFTYDVHGNMLTMPHLSAMTWDFADQLKSTTKGDDTTYYVYSGGERVRKVLHGSNGKRQYERIYLGGYELYRTYDTAGTTVQLERKTYHIMDDKRKVALLEVKTVDSATPVTNPVTITRYQYTNFIDSACLELDENALIISYEEFHPFGSTAYQLHTNNSQVSLKRYRYVHKERDEETGLYYYGARYHAGWLCRFISVDPLKDKFPFYSTYQYAGNKPITFIDLDGLEEGCSSHNCTGSNPPSYTVTVTDANATTFSPRTAQGSGMGISEDEFWNFLGEAVSELGVMTIEVLNKAGSWQNHAGYSGPSARPNLEKAQQEIEMMKNLPKQLDPNVQIENFSETVVTGTFNLVEGVVEGDGRKFARGVPFAIEVAGGAKAFIKLDAGSVTRKMDNGINLKDSDVPIGKNSLDNVSLKSSSKYGETVTMLEDGTQLAKGGVTDGFLDFEINVKVGQGGTKVAKGANVFDEFFTAVAQENGLDAIKGIKAVWYSGELGDNLATFNKLIKQGVAPKNAAKQTFTGIMADSKGFSNVSQIVGPQNADGTYKYVLGAYFTK